VYRHLSVVGEGYGYTALNADTSGFAATMLAFTYQVRPRFVIDSGLDVGVSHDAPQKRVFVGFTYAFGNVYALIRKPQS
jgi:hypothetical protein